VQCDNDFWADPSQWPTETELNRQLALKSLYEFVVQAWPVVEPGTAFLANWHIEAVCAHLEAVTDGRIQRLLINIPPGHLKSLLVSVFWPAWVWLRRPAWRGLFGAYAMDLSVRDSVRCRDLIVSDWYQDTFHPPWTLKEDQNAKSYFENSHTGYRLALSVGGRATGFRGDAVVVDDPLNARDQDSKAARQEAIFWWDKVMSARLNDHRRSAKVIIMQRLHEEDLSGHVLQVGGYEHLSLPSEFEPERACRTSIGWSDPRRQAKEVLFPTLYPREVLEAAKRDLGSDGYAGQHQQRPVPAEGSKFKRAWFRYYHLEGDCFRLAAEDQEPRAVPTRLCRYFLTVDLATSTKTTADYTVVAVWGDDRQGNLLLVDLLRERLEAPDILPQIHRLRQRWQAEFVAIERAGFQLSFIQTARRQGLPVRELQADRDKIARATVAQVRLEAGTVWFPEQAAWLGDFEAELLHFPHGAHDDCVDVLAYAAEEIGSRYAQPKCFKPYVVYTPPIVNPYWRR
jgi:predicted phage terminase large subunit-like protein